MNNLKTILAAILVVITLSSCKKEDDTPKTLKVTLSAIVTGNLTNATISYNDINGTLKTETLTGNWNKVFTVPNSSGYNLSFKASGTNSGGKVEIIAKATGNGINFEDSKATENSNSFDFDFTINNSF